MKPRLKLRLDGSVVLLSPGDGLLNERHARRLVERHWGSIERFAERMGLSYWAACQAMTFQGRRSAGQIREARLMLGLPSTPTAHAVRCSGARS